MSSIITALPAIGSIKGDAKALNALLKARQSAKPEDLIVLASQKIEEFGPTRASIKVIRFLFGNPRAIYNETRDRSHTRRQCLATHTDYDISVFRSRTQESFGEPTIGTRILVMGYYIAQDTEGLAIYEDILNPDFKEDKKESETNVRILGKKPKLITEDEAGNPIEAQVLMRFSPYWGADRSRPKEAKLSGRNTLVLIPGQGVPRQRVTIIANDQTTTTPTTNQNYADSTDWSCMPGLQHELERPMLELADDNEDMKEFVSLIQIAANAPSLRAEKAKANSQYVPPVAATTTSAGTPTDAFAGAPEETEEE